MKFKVFFLLLYLLVFTAISSAQELTQEELGSLSEFGIPIHCPGETMFKFTYIRKKQHKDGKIDEFSTCKLVKEYSSHIEELQNFWPVTTQLGLYIQVITEDSEHYNAYFHGNLYSEKSLPGLGLIINKKLDNHIELQKKVWTHEYGHVIFDQYVRKNLTSEVSFEKEVRLAIEKYREDWKNLEDSESDTFDRMDQLKNQIDQAQHEYKYKYYSSLKFSDKFRGFVILEWAHEIQQEIENFNLEIENTVFELYSIQGHLDYVHSSNALMTKYGFIRKERPWLQRKFNFKQNKQISNLTSKIGHFIQYRKRGENLLNTIVKDYPEYDIETRVKKFQSLKHEKEEIDNKYSEAQAKLDILEVALSILKVKIALKANESMASFPNLSVYSALHETFADYVAVLYHKDKEVVSSTLSKINSIVRNDTSSTSSRFSRSFESVKHYIELPNHSHGILFQTRQYLGKNYYSENLDVITENLHIFLNAAIRLLVHTWGTERVKPYQYEYDESLLSDLSAINNKEDFESWYSATDFYNLTTQPRHISWSSLRTWCSRDFETCKQFIVKELEKQERGLFRTTLSPEKINDLFISILSTQ